MRGDILNVLKTVGRAVSPRANIPVLEGYLLSIKENKLTITGTDLTITIRATVEYADIEEPGEIVAGKKLLELLTKLPDEKVVFSTINTQLIISYGINKFTMNCFSATDYPNVDTKPVGQPIKLVKGFGEISFCCSQDDSRPVFSGVYIDTEHGKAVATDTFRLAVMDFPAIPDVPHVIIPKKFIELIPNACDLYISDKTAMAVNDKCVYITKLIQGNFPNWKRIIPENYLTEAVFDGHALFQAVERAGILSDGVDLYFSADGINMSVRNENGNLFETILCDEFNGEPVKVSLANKYIKEALKPIRGKCVVKLTSEFTPMVVNDSETEGWLCVLVPRRIN